MNKSTNCTVLNVCADVQKRKGLTLAFKLAGFTVWEAESGNEALDMAQQRPDLILLDRGFPDMPASEIYNHLKTQTATTSIPVCCVDGPLAALQPTSCIDQPKPADHFSQCTRHSAEVVDAARNALQARIIEVLSSQFIEASSDAVLVVDASSTIIHLNTQTEKLFGYRRNELLDKQIELLMPERFRKQHAEHRRNYFKTPLPRPMGSSFAAVGLRKDGTEFPIDIALSPLLTESGLYVASTIRDISAQRLMEDELRQRARDLEEADHHKVQFLSILAHELRSPLAAIAYSADYLRQPGISAEARKHAAGIILEETNLVRRLLDDLSDLPRIQHGELPVHKTLTDLGEASRLAVEICHPLIEQRKHKLEFVAPWTPLHVQGDAARLTQIVTNLLTNAARYTPDGGHIRLSFDQENGMVVLRVEDNGIGIPADMLTRVFGLFTRLDAARQKYASGLGMGLAYVQRLVEIHGGSVQAFSEGEGRGAELVVRLPLAADNESRVCSSANGTLV